LAPSWPPDLLKARRPRGLPIHSWRNSWRALSFAAFLTSAFVPPALADGWETCAKGAGDEAIAACTRAIKSGTYNGKTLALAYSNRGVEWRAKGDLARAHRRLRRSHQGGSAAVGRLQQPRHRPRRRRYDKAIADYDKATELNPTYASALNNRGLAYFNNGQKERAIADYDAAIKIEPDAVRLNNRGNAYASRAQYDRAIQDFDAAVNLHARYAVAVYNRGNAHFAKGDADRACRRSGRTQPDLIAPRSQNTEAGAPPGFVFLAPMPSGVMQGA
jgi:tetratricopeptide (TPR) repeat protein